MNDKKILLDLIDREITKTLGEIKMIKKEIIIQKKPDV